MPGHKRYGALRLIVPGNWNVCLKDQKLPHCLYPGRGCQDSIASSCNRVHSVVIIFMLCT